MSGKSWRREGKKSDKNMADKKGGREGGWARILRGVVVGYLFRGACQSGDWRSRTGKSGAAQAARYWCRGAFIDSPDGLRRSATTKAERFLASK
jgi:hypothetical protein